MRKNEEKTVIDETEVVTDKKPKGKKVHGTGEGLVDFDKVILNIEMGSRPNTKPGGSGMEGYPTMCSIVEVMTSHKMPQENAGIQNKHVAGCALSYPGKPNHIIYYVPKGSVTAGQKLACEGVWSPIMYGANVTGYN